MAEYPDSLARLVEALTRLPGIGRKTAQRLAFHLARSARAEVEDLADSLRNMAERLRPCATCFNFAEDDLCPVCADPRRDASTICVVERASDLPAIERTGFRGLYHVLGGSLSPLGEVGPDDLTIQPLIERVRGGGVQEVILASNPTVEGEATAHYLAEALLPAGIRVTRVAQGLPVGSDLEYTDQATLARALAGRREVEGES
jgi:recombination protein RecR